jgi:hypothetical protein
MEKDALIDYFHRNGRFPADTGVDKTSAGKTRRGAGYIETEVKAFHWYEFLQVFAPIGLFALILYTFYGALPSNLLNFIQKRPAILEKIQMFQKQLAGSHAKLLTGPEGKAWSNELFRLSKTASNIMSTSTKDPVRKTPIRKAIANGTVPAKRLPIVQKAPSTVGKKAVQPAKPIAKNKGAVTKLQQSVDIAKQKPKPVRKAAPPKLEAKSATKPAVKLPPKKLGPKKLNPASSSASVTSNSMLKTSAVGQRQQPATKKAPAKKPLTTKHEGPPAPKKLDAVPKLPPAQTKLKSG